VRWSGFCGRESAEGRCAVTLTTGRTAHATSACALAVEYKYGQALKGSDATPCTNVPLICKLCPLPLKITGSTPITAVWRYNILQHIAMHHPGHDLRTIPSDFLQSIQISPEEQQKIGIPQEQVLPFILSSLTPNTRSTKRKRGPEQSNGHDLPRASRRRQ